MSSTESIKDEINKRAPHLGSVSKSHPFKVPLNYFEALDLQLFSRIRAERNDEPAKTTRSPLVHFVKAHRLRLLIAAASVLLVFFSLYFFEYNRAWSIASEEPVNELWYASELDESLVFEMYADDKESSANELAGTDQNEYLKMASEIDPFIVDEF